MIAGSTFALFTSESKVDIAVTSGKVEVSATIGGLETSSMGVAQAAGTFANGGSATLSGGTLTLANVTPGDMATFVITATNSSTVSVRYRFTWSISGELAPYLTATVDGNAIVNNSTPYAIWEGDSTKSFNVAVELPATVGNEAQGKTADISFRVEAVQGNVEEDFTLVSSGEELAAALANNAESILLTDNVIVSEGFTVSKDTVINGGGNKILRTSPSDTSAYEGAVFTVKEGKALTLENVDVDGGAVWGGEVNPVLGRGTVNNGLTVSGALVVTEKNSTITLGKGAILQNNDGANAVNLGTRTGGKLVIDGGEIINNHADAGAIWGGGQIIMNSGKVNGNHGGIGGAIRVVTNVGNVLTMNGGEMNHNYSDGNGGAMYAGYYETVKIGGDFKMHDNACAEGSGSAIRFHNHATLEMTGGEIYNHGENALYLNNNSATITGGKIEGSFGYNGGLGLTMGNAEIDGVINYNLATNHNTAYLAEEFGSFKFTVNASAANFAQFNLKPAAGYTYTEGDEAKLVCMNEGYETYWDAATSTFRLRAK